MSRSILLLSCLFTFGWLGWHHFKVTEETHYRTECMSHLNAIGAALIEYRKTHQSYPPQLTDLALDAGTFACPSTKYKGLLQSYLYPMRVAKASGEPGRLIKRFHDENILVYCLEHSYSPYSRKRDVVLFMESGKTVSISEGTFRRLLASSGNREENNP